MNGLKFKQAIKQEDLSSCDEMIDEYISKHSPYDKFEPFKFDLRAYSKYIKEHNLRNEDITVEITNMFMID